MSDESWVLAVECTDPDASPFWEDEYEAIVQSYPKEVRERVRMDIMNGRNLEKYGIEVVSLCTTYDDFSRFMEIFKGE